MKILLEIHAKFFSLDRITSDDMLFILSIRFDILLSGIIIHSDDDDNDGKCRTACCYFTFLWMPTSLLSSYFHSSHRTHFVAFLDLTYRKEISPRTMRQKKSAENIIVTKILLINWTICYFWIVYAHSRSTRVKTQCHRRSGHPIEKWLNSFQFS